MTALKVILIILVVFFLIGLIRIGGRVEYSEEGVKAWAKVCGIPILVFPRPKKDKKPKKEKKPKKKKEKKKKKGKEQPEEEAGKKPKKKKGGLVSLVMKLLPIACQALGALKRRIRIDKLELHYIVAGTDAAATALNYGKFSAGAGAIVALLDENFIVKEQQVTVDVDFMDTSSTVYVDAALSIRIGQIVYIAVRYGIACLKVFLKHRKEQKKKAAAAEAEKKAENRDKAKNSKVSENNQSDKTKGCTE